MKKYLVLFILLISISAFAGELNVMSILSFPVIIEVNGQRMHVSAMHSGYIQYSGLSLNVKLYNNNGQFIKERKIETPSGKAIVTIFINTSGVLDMNLVPLSF